MDTLGNIAFSLRIQDLSRFVFVGISLLGIIYIGARFFQLYLTTLVLQGFFAILLFILVVIFQEDLRRFLEHIASWGRLKTSRTAATAAH
jgi:hypothetical protein